MKDWSVRAKTIGLSALIFYVPLISFLLARGNALDHSYFLTESFGNSSLGAINSSSVNVHDFLSFLIVYVVRVGVLLALFSFLPLAKKFVMLKGVLLWVLLPEFILIYMSFPQQQPPSPGPFSKNGWAILGYFIVIAISCIIQVIAMIVGAVRRPAILARKTT